MTIDLDPLDLKLLRELDIDARQPVSVLARTLKQGRDRVEYRMERLIKMGILSGFSCVVNPHRLSGSIYKIYLKAFAEENKRKEFLKKLHAHPRVFWISESDGKWNIMFSIVASDPIEFSHYQNELLATHRALIHEHEVYPIINATFFSRKYLSSKEPHRWNIGGDIFSTQLDDIDIKILQALYENCRRNISDLVYRIESTSDIVTYRIKKLEDSKVIVGYRANLDLSKVSMTLFKTQLYLDTYDPKQEAEFYKYCEKESNIVYIVQQIGRCQLEVEIEARDSYAYFRIIDDMQRKFSKFIRSTDTVLVRNEVLKWVVT